MPLPRIDFGVNYGAIATLKFKTRIIRKGNGTEQRISKWRKFLLDFQVGDRTLDRAELEVLQRFIATVRGKFKTFRFKNWLDFKAVNQAIATGNGVITQFQLTKTYGFTNPLTINITLPVEGTLSITVAGVDNFTWVCDYETGILSFSPAPTGAIVATYQFDVLCSLSVDATSHLFEAFEKDTGERFFKTGQITARQERI
jgi:uncharacterized protein (TIGR02217 family)